MNLYEITNGYHGQTEVRVYAWAKTEARALDIATVEFKKQAEMMNYKDSYFKRLRVRFLFSRDSGEFCTLPSDFGWYTEGDE